MVYSDESTDGCFIIVNADDRFSSDSSSSVSRSSTMICALVLTVSESSISKPGDFQQTITSPSGLAATRDDFFRAFIAYPTDFPIMTFHSAPKRESNKDFTSLLYVSQLESDPLDLSLMMFNASTMNLDSRGSISVLRTLNMLRPRGRKIHGSKNLCVNSHS